MITTTGEYALRAAVYLAQHHPDPQTTAQIAGCTKVPSGYLSKILQSMVRAELISSQRGLYGGFILERAPEDITVYDVLAAANAAPQRITKCPLGLKGHISLCPVHKLLDDAISATHDAFTGANLKTLCASAGGSVPLCDTSKEQAPAPSR
jgi:Rrf2 family nitric oxide-sensitive transcriptional repressor